jgi:hypothetical protein
MLHAERHPATLRRHAARSRPPRNAPFFARKNFRTQRSGQIPQSDFVDEFCAESNGSVKWKDRSDAAIQKQFVAQPSPQCRRGGSATRHKDKNSPYVTGRPNHPTADADLSPSFLIEHAMAT